MAAVWIRARTQVRAPARDGAVMPAPLSIHLAALWTGRPERVVDEVEHLSRVAAAA